ncbi:CPBP family intramembrane glutamic endopeptidase [Poseidonocella sp. HB161398]|uniref:CPBP family intramembrane glutamic endopeptidase n=1 Tax=Poseidonocella sp. HB161398 TaxID=2320855 RepID=UPI0011086F86|nr:CPBP family intramembrane glutamic endopeptidase [Poseidonocella sp. HB161398]
MARSRPLRPGRPALALAALVLWGAITILGAKLIYPPDMKLSDLATSGIGWHVLAAAGMLGALIRWQGWDDLGFRAPVPGTLWLLWLPGLMLAVLFGGALELGLPGPGVAALVLANSMLVGLSEETMFRGVLFSALRERLRIWPAILWTTGAFGAVHLFNGVLTGEVAVSALQAVAASCTGLMLLAIRLRTGSIWTAIAIHGLWDCATFLVVLSAGPMPADGGAGMPLMPLLLVPLLLVLPGLLYGLWLLRGIGQR